MSSWTNWKDRFLVYPPFSCCSCWDALTASAQCQDLALRVVVIDTLGHLSLVIPKAPWNCDRCGDCLQPKQLEDAENCFLKTSYFIVLAINNREQMFQTAVVAQFECFPAALQLLSLMLRTNSWPTLTRCCLVWGFIELVNATGPINQCWL